MKNTPFFYTLHHTILVYSYLICITTQRLNNVFRMTCENRLEKSKGCCYAGFDCTSLSHTLPSRRRTTIDLMTLVRNRRRRSNWYISIFRNDIVDNDSLEERERKTFGGSRKTLLMIKTHKQKIFSNEKIFEAKNNEQKLIIGNWGFWSSDMFRERERERERILLLKCDLWFPTWNDTSLQITRLFLNHLSLSCLFFSEMN